MADEISNEERVLRDRMRGVPSYRFRMEWNGGKIPDGATSGGYQVGWTQGGLITGTGGERLGTYQRVVDCGGPTFDKQSILIFTEFDTASPLPGGQMQTIDSQIRG